MLIIHPVLRKWSKLLTIIIDSGYHILLKVILLAWSLFDIVDGELIRYASVYKLEYNPHFFDFNTSIKRSD
jgi:hypothetical protein